jgi:hypothetical protein
MAGASLDINLSIANAQAVKAAFKSLQSRLADLTPVFQDIGEVGRWAGDPGSGCFCLHLLEYQYITDKYSEHGIREAAGCGNRDRSLFGGGLDGWRGAGAL